VLVRTRTPVKLFDQLHKFPGGFLNTDSHCPSPFQSNYISHLTAQREIQANFVDARAPPSFRRLPWMFQMIHYRARHAWTRTQLMADGCRSHIYHIISLHFAHFHLLLSHRSDKIGLKTRDTRTCRPFDLWILLTDGSCFLSTKRSCRERDFQKKRNEDSPLELSLKSPLHSAIGDRRDRSTIGGILTIRWTQAREPYVTEILPAGLVNYTYPRTKMAREKYARH